MFIFPASTNFDLFAMYEIGFEQTVSKCKQTKGIAFNDMGERISIH